ncbi:MAG: sulfatase-like hydrolase/transferase, partial [Bacteroidota bacterium]
MTHHTCLCPVGAASPEAARHPQGLWRQRLGGLAVALLVLAGGARAQGGEQPNVLFISVDDLSTAVGFLSEEPGNVLQTLYPDPAVRAEVRAVLTPNLDALAASGAPFAHAYAPSAICAPSRAALMTGVRTHVSGFYGGGVGFRDNEILADVATLPEYLRAHGYYTAGVGKIYHSPGSVTDENGEIVDDRADVVRSWETWISRSLSPNAPTTESRWSPNEDRFRFGVNDRTLQEQTDYRNADVIAQALRTGRGTLTDDVTGEPVTIQVPTTRPFFLGVGLYRPHLPWIVPDELRDLFDTDDLALTDDLRQDYFDDTDDLSPEGKRQVYRLGDEIIDGRAKLLYEHGESIASGGAIDAWKAAVQHYLASIAQADRIVGHLLASLDAGPYADNTIVVVWGGHGWH